MFFSLSVAALGLYLVSPAWPSAARFLVLGASSLLLLLICWMVPQPERPSLWINGLRFIFLWGLWNVMFILTLNRINPFEMSGAEAPFFIIGLVVCIGASRILRRELRGRKRAAETDSEESNAS
jgi:hypothetical protein